MTKENSLEVSSQHLVDLLQELPKRIQKDVINAAASAGATVVKKDAKKNIRQNGSVETGTLLNSIRTKKAKRQIGIYKIFSDEAAPHAHLVEFGTGPRKLKEPKEVKIGDHWVTITHTGTMPAKSFLRPAMDENIKEVMRKVAERWRKRTDKEMDKLTQKYGTMSKSYRKRISK